MSLEKELRDQKELGVWITNFWTNIQKRGKAHITLGALSHRKEILEEYWSMFVDRHRKIMGDKAAPQSDYVTNNYFATVEDAYFDCAARIRDEISVLQTSTSLVAPRLEQSMAASIVGGRSTLANLAKIELPTFDGEWLNWPSFKGLFESLVHTDDNLSKVLKLQYLKAHLSGEAADLLENVAITSEGYDGAWADLVDRYENAHLLLFKYMKNIDSCAPATKSSAAELKRITSTFKRSMRAFVSLKRPVDHWSDWLLFLCVERLDNTTRMHWQTSLGNSKEIPSFDKLLEFLDCRIQALTVTYSNASKSQQETKAHPVDLQASKTPKRTVVVHTSTMSSDSKRKYTCSLCQKGHSLGYCPKFKSLSIGDRLTKAKSLKVCLNCLSSNHFVSRCTSQSVCQVKGCKQKHHFLLHPRSKDSADSSSPNSHDIRGQASASFQPTEEIASSATSRSATNPKDETTSVSVMSSITAGRSIFLATARVIIENPAGEKMLVRALLDNAAESSFISERVAQILKVQRTRVSVPISGLQGVSTGEAKYLTHVFLRSPQSDTFHLSMTALILPNLSGMLPVERISLRRWTHLEGLSLADPDFTTPGRIDAILGADVYGALLNSQTRFRSQNEPTALSTVFGWVIIGPNGEASNHKRTVPVMHCTVPSLSKQLQRFWELETVGQKTPLSPNDEYCEQQFAESHFRKRDGRYVVRLPINSDESIVLGNTREAALRLFLSTERKLANNPLIKEKYVSFMQEYANLKHMIPVGEDSDRLSAYYLPHHAVFRNHDPNDKIRVVFNASFKSSSGRSLNDKLLSGPKLQSELWVVLSRWRMFQFAFTSDIVKMFRQVEVNPLDRNLQRILWRRSPESEIVDYQLSTVTYGTAPAPYLALRVLLQLATDEADRFPLGARVIRQNTYADDIFAGAETLSQALNVQAQVIKILAAGQFPLGKWAASHRELYANSVKEEIRFADGEVVSALGLLWDPVSDVLSLKVNFFNRESSPTKRSILSVIAKLFDPLGWIAPVIIVAKILIQDLWIADANWDDQVSMEFSNRWQRFRDSLQELEAIQIPRWTGLSRNDQPSVHLHGFCDASKRAYAACVYLRTPTPNGVVKVNLIVAKSKVAPIKAQTIPRLELCGALLLTRLMSKVQRDLLLCNITAYAWTDSEVVLAWLKGHSSKWPTFVSHRVAEIQEIYPACHWNYITSGQNPADQATRGLSPGELKMSQLWWQGPLWLQQEVDRWPERKLPTSHPTQCLLAAMTNEDTDKTSSELHDSTEFINNLLKRYSSLLTLQRVVSYCLRWLHGKNRNYGFIRALEMSEALTRLVTSVQRTDFAMEISMLEKKQNLPRSSSLLRLNPFVDGKGLLRVGGRLDEAVLKRDQKHPIILSKASPLSVLLVYEAHARTLHGGPQATRAFLMQRYWIIHGNTLVRQLIRNCVRCARFSGRVARQIMAPLPMDRVTGVFPFLVSGVDYAGPILLRTKRGRGYKTYKGYICLFVCLASKALHLEVVTDLTSASFLAAFRRFVSRRGVCSKLMSDNGRNFRGADKELQRLFRGASTFYAEAAELLAKDGTQWEFIPPYSPHFGGLWEAGVKSVKFHLKRVIGDQCLTFEEMSTLLCQIEACLNSRPLTPLSNDPTDLTPLTPGHFLIGRPITSVPEPGFQLDAPAPSTMWRLISKMRSDFWYRWRREYLHTIQSRSKWRTQGPDLAPGLLVLRTDELAPPTKWALARIVTAHRGNDGRVRVVTLRTAKGEVTRPIVKICPLPLRSSSKEADKEDS